MTIPQNKQLQLIGLNYKDDPRAAKAWLKAHGNPYQLVLEDRDGKTAINYGVYGTPETFLIDPTGKIVAKQVGVLDSTHFKEHFLPRIQQKS
jgi:cytochrome c biogenesis protein CcmG/thiol:disulfide interchange protein DsbE